MRTLSIPEHYAPAEVARKLGVSIATVRRMMAEGRSSSGKRGLWPWYKVGRASRVPAPAVQRLLERSLP
jgi:excisionase family DNA binding protein